MKSDLIYIYRKQESTVSNEDLIKQKMEKINAYRERLKQKSTVFSRNIKKENEDKQKWESSKTGSGIAGYSTRESQN
jgi:cell fate (sporulation/competence/biofilm development) regulator YmcA (YheA/YmcA/DUF963 family)